MNIIGHGIIGIAQSVFTGSVLPLIGSLLPDAVLISNEIKNRRKGQHFDEYEVNKVLYYFYMFTHSILFTLIVFYFNPLIAFGIFIHQLIDWFTHTNRFRTMPLFPFSFAQIGVKINDKKVLLISGGFDSVSILEMIDRKKYDFYFFDYGQSYYKEEVLAIKAIEKYYDIQVQTLQVNWNTDIRNRNFLMISRMQELGYHKICVGCRNLIPLFDKYKDSNYISLKIYALINRIVIETPVVFLTKKEIIKRIPNKLINQLYSTES
jgi:hypothetical protein